MDILHHDCSCIDRIHFRYSEYSKPLVFHPIADIYPVVVNWFISKESRTQSEILCAILSAVFASRMGASSVRIRSPLRLVCLKLHFVQRHSAFININRWLCVISQHLQVV